MEEKIQSRMELALQDRKERHMITRSTEELKAIENVDIAKSTRMIENHNQIL